MLTTNDLEKLIYKLRDLDRRMPEFYLIDDINFLQKIVDDVRRQPVSVVQIAIGKSLGITETFEAQEAK